jgi:hypothetical protein
MPADDWFERLVAYRRQGRSEDEIRDIARMLEHRGPRLPRTRAEGVARSVQIGMVTRALYVPTEQESRHLTRDTHGLPTLRLVDAGDRLAIWSPLDSGALLNPKGAGLRSLGLVTSYARGTAHHAAAYRSADLGKGRWVELRAEANNRHDVNAVAMYGLRSRAPFGYVQRGRAASVTFRLAKGEDLAGVCLWGPSKGRDDNTTFILIGTRQDLTAMTAGA